MAFYDVVTGHESWFYIRPIGRIQSNASCVAEGESPKTVVRQRGFEPKTMFSIFFNSNSVITGGFLLYNFKKNKRRICRFDNFFIYKQNSGSCFSK